MKENKKYNRLESNTDHFYLNDYGYKGLGNHKIFGYIKCKLAHASQFSVIIPDQVYFNWGGELCWIQPYNFLPCRLFNFEEYIQCDVSFDISFGYSVNARFKDSDLIKNYEDGSQLFSCELTVPEDIGDYSIGRAEIDSERNVYIELFHHTKPEIKELILQSKKLLGSKWNIQGSKELKNSEYVYFTPLHEIKVNNDLEKVAMSNESEIKLIRDNFIQPDILFPGWQEKYKDDLFIMKVYRENVENRNSTLSLMVPAEYIAPQHILKHSPVNQTVYYEMSAPFIHRIQIKILSSINFDCSKIIISKNVIYHEIIIIGDATTLDGLNAPFDEENTTHMFKIEFLNNQSMHEFWFENSNSNLFGERNCPVVNI